MSVAILDRLSFGAQRADIETLQKTGVNAWIESQLHPTHDDPVLTQALNAAVLKISYGAGPDYSALSENRPLNLLSQPLSELWKLTDNQTKMAYEERMRPLRELMASRLLHAACSQWQIKELMVDFWLDHFNVHASDASMAVSMPSFERDCIRRHALGNFSDMLQAVATSTPMLIYLNNRNSRTGAPNENYARELFELHTLGKQHYLNDLYAKWREVPGALQGEPRGYIDQDVYEAARAFTGWVIEDGRALGGGQSLPRTGQFVYLDAWHDPYQKRILAQDFDPFASPMSDGKRVLEMLVKHPGTAQNLCEKLCRRFVADTPPTSLVHSSSKVWGDNIHHPQQVARVLSHIFASAEFNLAVHQPSPKKLKRPLELVISLARKLELPLAPSMGLINEMSAAGHRLYMWPTPDGHPDVTGYWLTPHTMRKRWMLAMGVMENWWGTGQVTPQQLSQGIAQPVDEAKLLAHHAEQLLGPQAAQSAIQKILSAQNFTPKGLLSAASDEWSGVRRNLAYMAMSPAFQWK
ncbi:hypothetical protein B9Z39_13795 [Limnohabitans sp. JirII-29]|uniref:DUF1800 domain-containing protein n=1 Tax=unclassified Limnohabitans TaxID=2626134 RepID=UPI000C1F004B|nr:MULTISPECIES: DUF1800 domain-containing protein [unclassified Limnohabitans]PIT73862.1 hypothetical protein B9Z41_14295 [Limnohabitans sp. JirII-31]PUE24074.1 hypothetical protein B9Z39_13795 [Limnohabitans sp. JirII-29]